MIYVCASLFTNGITTKRKIKSYMTHDGVLVFVIIKFFGTTKVKGEYVYMTACILKNNLFTSDI